MDGSSLLSEQHWVFKPTLRGIFNSPCGSLFWLFSVFYYPSVTGVFLAAIKLVALLGYIHAPASLLTRDT